MRFFKKLEIAKPTKVERTSSECLANGFIKPLTTSELKLEKDDIIAGNSGFKQCDTENYDDKMNETEVDKTEENNKNDKIKNEEILAEMKKVLINDEKGDQAKELTDKEVKNNFSSMETISSDVSQSQRRRSTWENIQGKVRCCLDRPDVIHWMALFLIGLTVWSTVYSVAGTGFIPGSQLFSMLVLFVAAYISGEVIKIIRLPPLLGMLLMGLLLRNIGFIHLDGIYLEVTATLREIALCIILIRAGLGLDPNALKSLKFVILRLASIPGIVEGMITTVVTHFLLGLPWLWGMLLGAILAAVSPAVVIPCLFSLQERGYGTGKGIPTLVVAAASLDDIFAITVFGVVLNVIYSTGYSLTMQIIQGPLGIVIGILFGSVWGLMSHFIPHQDDKHVVLLRVLMISGGGLTAIIGSGAVGYQGAGPLGCIIAAFVACLGWRQKGYTDAKNPVADVFRIIWLVFQPVLFGLIGSEVDVSVLEISTIGNGFITLFCSLLGRIVVSIFIGYGAGFNWKEKTFIAWAWFPKATVQAALGPLALDIARRKGSEEEINYARTILVLAVLAILLTAPVGAILITTLGPRLLAKSDDKSIEEQKENSDIILESRNQEH